MVKLSHPSMGHSQPGVELRLRVRPWAPALAPTSPLGHGFPAWAQSKPPAGRGADPTSHSILGSQLPPRIPHPLVPSPTGFMELIRPRQNFLHRMLRSQCCMSLSVLNPLQISRIKLYNEDIFLLIMERAEPQAEHTGSWQLDPI